MVTAHVTVFRNGKQIGELEPGRWFYAHHEDEPRTMVAMRRTMGEDLYVVLAGYEAQSQDATYAVTINPLVNWIWFGFGILAWGTIIALLPERTFAFATAKTAGGRGHDGVAAAVVAAHSRDGESAAHREPAERSRHPQVAARARSAARDHLHVRHVRPPALGRVPVRHRRADARGDGRAGCAGHDARAGLSVLHRQVRQPGAARLADRQGLQPRRVGAAVRRGRERARSWSGSSPSAGRAATMRPRRLRTRPPRGRTMPERILPFVKGWTMSSATSTRESFSVGHLFVLLSLLAATIAVVMARPSTPESLIFISLTIGAAGLRGRLLLPAARPARRAARRYRSSPRQRAPARGSRAREGADAAVDQGARVRSGDGEAVAAGFRSDGGPLARARDRDHQAAGRRGGELSRACGKGSGCSIGQQAGSRHPRRARLRQGWRGSALETRSEGGTVGPARLRFSCACGVANDRDARFCKSCGSKLVTA